MNLLQIDVFKICLCDDMYGQLNIINSVYRYFRMFLLSSYIWLPIHQPPHSDVDIWDQCVVS
jgi:hypothetical protein